MRNRGFIEVIHRLPQSEPSLGRSALTAIAIAAALLCCYPRAALAAKLPELKEKMSPAEVLGLWGEPQDKEERETRRQEIWYYPNGNKAIFEEGALSSWKGQESPRLQAAVAPEPIIREAPRSGSRDAFVVEEILEEIMKEVPSGDETKPVIGGQPPPPGIVNPAP